MTVFLVSSEDAASVNIRDRLLEEGRWESIGAFEGSEIYLLEDIVMVQKKGMHLYFEDVDEEISNFIRREHPDIIGRISSGEYPLDLLVFLSKHRSEMDIRSLTVHPPGNFNSADYGGEPGYLPPSAPLAMTAALKSLYAEKRRIGLKDRTTYEVTHHGPRLSSPSFFIEIGSNESRWGIGELARPIAGALLSKDFRTPRDDLPIAVGIGGGHYAPRFTDRAMRNKFAFGHMVPDYIMEGSNDLSVPIGLAVENTPGAECFFIHRSGRNEELMDRVIEACDDIGLKIANRDDVEG
ncbi:MAG: D-aminoacyl-tRNA deacylase [Thermoplasmatota archaeon]